MSRPITICAGSNLLFYPRINVLNLHSSADSYICVSTYLHLHTQKISLLFSLQNHLFFHKTEDQVDSKTIKCFEHSTILFSFAGQKKALLSIYLFELIAFIAIAIALVITIVITSRGSAKLFGKFIGWRFNLRSSRLSPLADTQALLTHLRTPRS